MLFSGLALQIQRSLQHQKHTLLLRVVRQVAELELLRHGSDDGKT
jgi:hypothetical protein